jgi:hypothetical protein
MVHRIISLSLMPYETAQSAQNQTIARLFTLAEKPENGLWCQQSEWAQQIRFRCCVNRIHLLLIRSNTFFFATRKRA